MELSAPVRRCSAAVLAALVGLLLLGAAPAQEPAGPSSGVDAGVDAEAVPALARDLLPLVTALSAEQCPELPPVWIVAQVQAESGWDPALVSAGAAGLYQFGARNWETAGGEPWSGAEPAADDDVLDAEAHLRVAVPWVCANLRAVAAHLEVSGKPTAPLDAMLVCHVAGCGRVTGSATGTPAAGEAGCGERCAQVVARYVAAVHANVERFTAPAAPPAPPPAEPSAEPPAEPPADPPTAPPAPAPPPPAQAAPAPWTGGATGCAQDDPTSGGCLTGAAAHGLASATAAFGPWQGGPVIRDAGCWDEHAWNPRSDHPRGRACDLFASAAGTFAEGADLDDGWRVANWFREHAGPLRVAYLIWHGRYWDPGVADTDGGWGRRYTGGGVYDVRNATGGHFDHVHVSFQE